MLCVTACDVYDRCVVCYGGGGFFLQGMMSVIHSKSFPHLPHRFLRPTYSIDVKKSVGVLYERTTRE